MDSNKTIFTINYLPNIQYMAHWVVANDPVLESSCSYIKQTYRNRCDILAANGVIPLTIPIAKRKKLNMKTKDVEISYDTRWQSLHWRSVVSAYNSSPFFEYYKDDFAKFFEKEYRFLYDFNLEVMQVILDSLELSKEVCLTKDYEKEVGENCSDFRNIIHPKKDYTLTDKSFNPKPYRQVFQDKFEFTPNLSVIDLIFNKGPEAIDWLEDCIVPVDVQ